MKRLLVFVLLCCIGMAAAAQGARSLHYRPEGNSAVLVSGNAQYNRALYGAHNGFRLECSDSPIFAFYFSGMCGHMELDPGGLPVQTIYTAGKMNYRFGSIEIEAQMARTGSDIAILRLHNRGSKAASVPFLYGGASGVKFNRNGDLGVDDPHGFDLNEQACRMNRFDIDGNQVTVHFGERSLALFVPAEKIDIDESNCLRANITLRRGETLYLACWPDSGLSVDGQAELAKRFAEAETERARLTSALTIRTPDPYINPIGEALVIAADGIWNGETWLHGAVGWRSQYLGWRGAYVGDALGWTDRSDKHFRTYADNQITDIPPIYDQPCQEPRLNMASSARVWGSPFYSNGYICRRPGHKEEMSHYDMNLVYIDALLRHLLNSGDTAAMRHFYPTIRLHLEWEKRNFDADGDFLYDAYACIWASDALYYEGGDVTHSTAYNYFANYQMARIAEVLGEDPEPYRQEAEGILKALNEHLWLEDDAYWAEFQDLMGLGRVHRDAALWSIYHSVDSDICDPFQAYTSTVYVDEHIPHIRIETDVPGDYYELSTSDWKPYEWSINNVALAEVMHTALAYWQAGRNEEAFQLMKSVAIDNMYLGTCPLNFGQIGHYDAARGECYRDFADPVGVWARVLNEGLYGIRKDLLAHKIEVIPGFPAEWDKASILKEDLSYSFVRRGRTLEYRFDNRCDADVELVIPVSVAGIRSVRVNGRKADWSIEPDAIGTPRIRIAAGGTGKNRVSVRLRRARSGQEIQTLQEKRMGRFLFTLRQAGDMQWWEEEHEALPVPAFDNGFDEVQAEKCRPVRLDGRYNANATDLFRNKYLSPRPTGTTLEIPVQGIGDWCSTMRTAHLDDSGLRDVLRRNGGKLTAAGIPFQMPASGRNTLYTTLWDNYPNEASIPLGGSASHAYMILIGSTNPMQFGIENGEVIVRYTDGSESRLALLPTFNWAPAEQDYFFDNAAFALLPGQLPPQRFLLSDGSVHRGLGMDGAGGRDETDMRVTRDREIPGGAGVLVDMDLNPGKTLQSLTLRALSNDVVIGMMALTLQD